MITQVLIDAVMFVPLWLLDTIPSIDLPSALVGTGDGTLVGAITTAASYAGSLDSWFPITQAVLALAFVMLCFGVGSAVKIARIVASFFTGGGGSAA